MDVLRLLGLGITSLLLYLAIIIVIWLLIRELNTWYWKINKRIELQEENNKLLREILTKINIKPPSKEDIEKNKQLLNQTRKGNEK